MAMSVKNQIMVGGIGFLMMIQNYLFFMTYWKSYSHMPQDGACAGSSWWLGCNALVCAIETVFVGGMMLGAWWDGSRALFWFFWVLHLIDAVPGYTAAVVFLGTNLHGEDGQACIEANPSVGHATFLAWCVQVGFYVVYVFCMLGLSYLAVFKADEKHDFVLKEADNDKLLIFALGLMMMVQNFSFALTYWDLFMAIDGSGCDNTWWWLGYNAVVCGIEVVFAGGMMLGGWFDGSKVLFWVFWVLHAIDAVPGYTGAVVFLGQKLQSESGLECIDANPSVGARSTAVWKTQVAFYVFYVFCMLAITYLSAIKKPAAVQGIFHALTS